MATATREAYGKTLANLIVEHDDLFVLDADLTKSTKTIDAKKACLLYTSDAADDTAVV